MTELLRALVAIVGTSAVVTGLVYAGDRVLAWKRTRDRRSADVAFARRNGERLLGGADQ